ncbi:hypothetical protein O3G_MSEX007890 [Manduca sexta]|uniref:Cyclic nucleotide-binding domain-containing protein n=2 Tax=Manduca sexta TaxID=7130 RepID=A0A921Z7V3_MANSE|nr:hypothetical protein O3G_MSEX007890 [Manduca sexta]
MVYMVYVGEFSNIIQYQSFRSFSFYCMYLELQEFLKNNRVSKNLVAMVNNYSLHLWREARGMQEPYFLKTAPQCLRLRIMSAAYLYHLTKHHIFEECEPAFLRQLVGCLQLFTYNENMFVVKESEITDAMYFVHTGRIQETKESSDKPHRVYPAGSYFGVTQGLICDTPYTHSYMTITKSQVLTLHLGDWVYLMKHFPASKAAIQKYVKGPDTDNGQGPGDKKYGGSPPPPRDQPRVIEQVDKGSPPSRSFSQEKHTKFTVPTGPKPPDGPNVNVPTGQWPMDSRNTRDSETLAKDFSELEKLQVSTSYDQSQGSMSTMSQDLRGTKSTDVAATSSSVFMSRVASTAKKLMGKQSDVLYAPSIESIDKDVLLLQEDEDATTALMQQFGEDNKSKESSRERVLVTVSDVSIATEDGTEDIIVAVDMTQSKIKINDIQQADNGIVEKQEIKQTKSSVKMPAETEDTEAPSTSRLSRRQVRVRYKDDEKNDGPEEKKPHTTRFVSDDLTDTKPFKDLSAQERNFMMFDSDIHVETPTTGKAETEEQAPATGSSSTTPDSNSSTSLKRTPPRPSE